MQLFNAIWTKVREEQDKHEILKQQAEHVVIGFISIAFFEFEQRGILP